MALSDTGDLDEAEEHLRKAIEIDPTFTNAKVALGVVLCRKRQWEQAASVLKEAVEEEGTNPYALRNLGACLLALDTDVVGRTIYLRRVTAILPEDQQSWMNLGQALELGNKVAEADAAYRKAIEINPGNPIAESARRALTRIAKKSFNEAGIGVVRRDAVAYCVSAIEKFSKMSRLEIKRCAFEIAAALAIKGIKVNCRDKSYTLKSMKGSFSGLELLCYQFVACKRRGHLSQQWFDLSKEYEAALRFSERG